MKKDDIWCGFLEAGAKSTPVVRDSSVGARSDKFLRLFNYTRGTFVEYSREIVEPKLRELNGDEIPVKELKAAFRKARKKIAMRDDGKTLNPPTQTSAASKKDDPDLDDYSMEMDDDGYDDDEIED